jgi:Ni/Fe-hydrogenase subunit HybB-like protein
MEWYWWVLIGVGVVAIGYLKIKVGGKMLAAMKAKKDAQAAIDEE